MEKQLFKVAFKRFSVGGIGVRFWDGEAATFGPEDPYVTLVIHHRRALRAMMRNITLGFGESYMAGDITVEGDLAQLLRLADMNTASFDVLKWARLPQSNNTNQKNRQRQQIAHHYDLGNAFYQLWLDHSMTYSCAYFKTDSNSLEEAQAQKVDYILRKLQLKPGQRLLDIGSGWGQLLIAAAKQYGIQGLGITLSQEQYELSNERAKELGLEKLVSFELLNYQDLAIRGDKFDRIVSVGMYEHVGRNNHSNYFAAVKTMLAPSGLSVLHTITDRRENPVDPWIDKYIFPGGYIPSVAETTAVMGRYGFELQDYENLRFHYAKTIAEWRRRYLAAHDEVVRLYDERFYRMWELYLAGSYSGFKYGDLTLSQFVITVGPNEDLPLTREHLYNSPARE
jgi:cyclopropane-fatty-acyl-phospholipid synthase